MADCKDYPKFIDFILDRLLLKKMAMFSDYKMAKDDLFLELFPYTSEEADLAKEIWDDYESKHDPKAWFDSF